MMDKTLAHVQMEAVSLSRALVECLMKRFPNIGHLELFKVLEPRRMAPTIAQSWRAGDAGREGKKRLEEYGVEEIKKLGEFYGKARKVKRMDPNNTVVRVEVPPLMEYEEANLLADWKSFKTFVKVRTHAHVHDVLFVGNSME